MLPESADRPLSLLMREADWVAACGSLRAAAAVLDCSGYSCLGYGTDRESSATRAVLPARPEIFMDFFQDLSNLFAESRMKYGHLIILFLYGLIALFLFEPFLGLLLYPPAEAIDLAQVEPYYWHHLAFSGVLSAVFYVVVAFNVGLLLYALQVMANKIYWRRIVRPLAVHVFGLQDDCERIEMTLVESTRFGHKGDYARFLYWVEQQENRRRVRSWDWFIANAIRTFGFLLFLFLVLYLVTLVLLLLAGGATPVTVSLRSWVLALVAAGAVVLLVPADVKHYRVHAEADQVLLEEFQKHNISPGQKN